MQLSLFELAKSINMHPDIVERWIRQGRIPVKRKGDTCTFNKEVLEKWAVVHSVRLVMPGTETPLVEDTQTGLFIAMSRGGVHFDLPGTTVDEVLRAGADRIEGLGSKADRDLVYEKLLEREQMMSTGIGNKVAVPHPRTPIVDRNIETQIATCFLEHSVDFQAVDKKKVNVLFILVAPSAKQHLYLLSRISFCLKDSCFLKFLESRPDRDAYLNKIGELEKRLN